MHITMHKIIWVIWLAQQLTEILAIESPEPASLLRPRDYNPHPYLNSIESENILERNLAENNYKFLRNIFNQGPVQFPQNTENVKRLPHPYAKLALQDREKKTQRFAGGDKQALKIAYTALAKHAKRVLKQNYNDIDYEEQESAPSKKHYAFSYTVKDKASGDDFSHTQQQKDGAVKGSYNVQLPDGRMQIVNYIADNNGYRAEVSYEGEGQQSSPAANPTPSPRTTADLLTYHQYYKNRQQNSYEKNAIAHSQYYPQQVAIEHVNVQNYNESPHAKLQNVAPYFVVSTTAATPTILQTNSLAPASNIVATTPIYHDIHVKPIVPSTSPIYLEPKANYQQSNLNYDYNYQSNYYDDYGGSDDNGQIHQYYKRSINNNSKKLNVFSNKNK